MPESSSALQIRGFKGLNVREYEGAIQDNELSEAINFDLGRAGELIKRTGFEALHQGQTLGNNSVKILGHFLTETYSQLIVKAGSNVYSSSDGISYTLIGTYADAEWGIQYAGVFYIIRKTSTIVSWNGVTATAITGSPAGTFAITYKERMFVLNSEAPGSLNSRFYFSKVGDVTTTGWSSVNFIDVRPGDGDFLTCMAVIQDLLIIFKGRSTWGLYVQPAVENWVLRNLNSEIGCISKYTTKEVEGFLYLSGARAVYRTDGTTFEDISEPINPVLKNRIVNLTTTNIDSFAWWDDKLICLLSPNPSIQEYYIFHIKAGGWTKWEFAGGIKPTSFTEVRTNNPQAGLYAGDLNSTGKVYRYGGSGYADSGVTYPCSMKTKQFDFDIPTNMKRGKWVGLDTIGLATINWQNEVEGVPYVSGTAVGDDMRTLVKIPGPGYFRTWRFGFNLTTATEFTLLGVTLHMLNRRTVIRTAT